MNMTININDIEIKIKLLNYDTIFAQATLIICRDIEIKGWKVLKSNRPHKYLNAYVWIQAPSIKAGSSWKETVFINNESLYREVEMKVYEKYLEEKERQGFTFTEEDERKIEEMSL